MPNVVIVIPLVGLYGMTALLCGVAAFAVLVAGIVLFGLLARVAGELLGGHGRRRAADRALPIALRGVG